MRKIAGVLLAISMMAFASFVPNVAAEGERGLEDEIIYNIMIDRYNNGTPTNDTQVNLDDQQAYQGGDLQGVIAKLDDLQEIGVTTISLSSLMENSEKGFHGYWIEDFYQVEEHFGTMEDLQTLIEEAHNRGMKVVMEFVANYAAASHPFIDDPEKADWFIDNELTDPAWMENTARLNLEHPDVEAYLLDIAEYWMNETEIDGFKLQAVDQAPLAFLKSFTQHVKELNPEFYLLGDILVTDENSAELISDTSLDAVSSMRLKDAMVEVFAEPDSAVKNIYEVWQTAENQKPLLYMDDFNSKRFTQEFSENRRNTLTTWSLALTYMYTTPGVPMVLQGSELPMYGADAEESQRLVPFNSGEPDLKEFHNRISALRNEFPVLRYGDFEIVDTSDAMSVFKRTYKDESMYIAINNGSESAYVDIADIPSNMELRGYLGDNLVRENENGDYRIGLARESAEVYTIQPDAGINWLFIGFVAGVFILFVGAVIYLSTKQKKRMQ
ncbi:alpha-amylase family glycosyl hydrolase [Oceanobacillus sp. FSL K6-2867]|uniref:alpha-amylase family glycosyl hydrolase n=1 Tax=Oceanobacillus sp. FSL K6-2867 TaxID=2954748 RepID=UPI0030DAC3DB